MLNPTLTPSNDLLTHLEKEEQKIIKQINNNGYRTPYEPDEGV
jgi:hypothetical protein